MATLVFLFAVWGITLFFHTISFYAGCGIIALVAILLLILPLEGFKEKELKHTYTLAPIKYDEYGEYYVMRRGRKIVFLYQDVDDVGASVQVEKCVRGRLIICETEECLEPVLHKYVRKVNRDFWAIALGIRAKTEYVLVLPKQV